MADITVTDLPDDVTFTQGYFVWQGFDGEGRKLHGGIEFPYSEHPEITSYDAMATIGMLSVAQEKLMASMVYGDDQDDE